MVQTVSKTVDTAEFRRRGVQTPMATTHGGELTQHGAYGAALTQHAVQSELAVVICRFFFRQATSGLQLSCLLMREQAGTWQ